MTNKGTYALALFCSQNSLLKVGRRREMHVEAGFYVYIGSAFGSGGLSARLSRHFRHAKSKHWHIDYLREITTPLFAWVSYAPIRLEHRWAEQVSKQPAFTAIPRFGCSDCRCLSHLFFTASEANLFLLRRSLAGNVEKW